MPSDRKGGRGRSEIYNWRVKIGRHKGEVFSKRKAVCDCRYIAGQKRTRPPARAWNQCSRHY